MALPFRKTIAGRTVVLDVMTEDQKPEAVKVRATNIKPCYETLFIVKEISSNPLKIGRE